MRIEKTFNFYLNTSIFLALFELAAGYSFYMFEVSLVCLLISFIFLLFKRNIFRHNKFFYELANKLKYCSFAVIMLILYIFYDFINITYSQDIQLSLSKLKVVLLMMFLSICILFYCKNGDRLDNLLIIITAVGLFSAVLVIVNSVVLRTLPMYYNFRLSLRVDYNVFATVLLISLIIGVFFIILNLKDMIQHILLFGICIIIIPVIIISGSRRIFVILPFVLIIFYFVFAFVKLKQHKNYLKLLYILINFIAVVAAVCSITFWLNGCLQKIYLNGGDVTNGIKGEETSLNQRYETILSGSYIQKRGVLWAVALDEFKEYKLNQIIFGKGGSYDIILYDNSNSKLLDNAYPDRKFVNGKLSAHNMLLADLLNGGVIKALLLIVLTITLIVDFLKLLITDFLTALPYCISISVVYLNNLISNRFGILYDKFFYIILFLSIIEISLICKCQRRLGR